jgi:anti-anti-sigma factor
MLERKGDILLDAAGSARVLRLCGDHDASTIATLEPALDAAILDEAAVIVDLSECTFLDSSCVAVLFRARQRAAGGRLVAVIEPGSAMAASRLLDLVRFSSVVPVYESREDAARAVTG